MEHLHGLLCRVPVRRDYRWIYLQMRERFWFLHDSRTGYALLDGLHGKQFAVLWIE
jgi:hypothetical protein